MRGKTWTRINGPDNNPRHRAKAGSSTEEVKSIPVEKGHETILLAEDEPAILKLTSTMLSKPGYNVLAANTPGETIRLALEYNGEIHLLITDVVMPEMNRRDLAKNNLYSYPNIRRLFMSGYTANVIVHHEVVDEGVNFINKPFSYKQLGTKVREVLEKD